MRSINYTLKVVCRCFNTLVCACVCVCYRWNLVGAVCAIIGVALVAARHSSVNKVSAVYLSVVAMYCALHVCKTRYAVLVASRRVGWHPWRTTPLPPKINSRV